MPKTNPLRASKAWADMGVPPFDSPVEAPPSIPWGQDPRLDLSVPYQFPAMQPLKRYDVFELYSLVKLLQLGVRAVVSTATDLRVSLPQIA
jgi:hypothetical protein